MSELDRSVYTVAWIAPLEIEALAALHMLDERHRGRFPCSDGDKHVFHGGVMCGHHVVIATIPPGDSYGTVSAATLASEVRRSFPNLRFGLLVGVAAGIPDLSISPPRDIRLGDVLVALPDPVTRTPALVAYDLGKETAEGDFELLQSGHTLRTTDKLIRSAIGSLKMNAPSATDIFLPYWRDMRLKQHSRGTFSDPGQDRDQLYLFSSTGQKTISRRQLRPDHNRTRVWYGPIGSGSKLMKNPRFRDQLRDKHNIIGLEMEAAGVMEIIPVGVIRGVSDYADEHKNKDWQTCASAIAAAYGKAVLQETPLRARASIPFHSVAQGSDVGPSQLSTKATWTLCLNNNLKRRTHDLEEFGQRSKSETHTPDSRFLSYRSTSGDESSGISSSLNNDVTPPGSQLVMDPREQWPDYQTERPPLSARFVERCDIPASLLADSETWRTSDRQFTYIAVIYGLSGVGKSQMCLRAIAQQQKRFRGVFYVDASNPTTASNNYLDISRVCNIQSHEEGIELEERIRIIRSWLANQKDPWLLMIDGANSSDSALQEYIPKTGYGTVLITTTDENVALHGHTFSKLGIMDEFGAIDLLMSYKRPEAVLSSEENKAARILAVNTLGCLPLAVAQAGSYIFNKFCTYQEYAQEFEASPGIVLRFEPVPSTLSGPQESVWNTFVISLNQIQKSSQPGATEPLELLQTLSYLHHERIPLRLFELAWSNLKDAPTFSYFLPFLDTKSPRWDTPNLRATFDILRRYSILNFASPGAQQFSMHKLIHTICRESLSEEQRYKHAFRAASLIAMALHGIRAPLSWIDNPSGFLFQRCLIPHIKVCTADGIRMILDNRPPRDWRIEARILVLFARAYSATGHFKDALDLLLIPYMTIRYHEKKLEELKKMGDAIPAWMKLSDKELEGKEMGDVVTARLRLSEEAEKGDHTALQVMELLAACNAHFGSHQSALIARRHIVKVQTANPAYDTGDQCVAMMNLSDSLWATGQRAEALAVSKRVSRSREKKLSPDDPKLLRSRRKVAEYLHGSDLRFEALKMREQILRDAESRVCQSDIETLDLLASKNALADSYQWDGQLLKALEIRRSVYSGRRSILGSEHPDTLLAYDRLIGTKSSINDKKEQKEVCEMREKSVQIWTRILGDLHEHTLEAKVNLGHSYSTTGQLQKAIMVQETVLQVQQEQFNKRKDLSVVSHFLSSMGNLANLMTKSRRSEDALGMRKRALAIAQEYLGDSSRVTFKIRNNLITCLASQAIDPGVKGEVLKLRMAIKKEQKNVFGKRDAGVLKVTSLLAIDLADSDIERSIRTRKKLLKKQKSKLGDENRESLDNTKRLAISLAIKASCGGANFEEPTALMETVVDAQIRLLGEMHDQTCDTRIELLCLYDLARERDKAHSLAKALDALETGFADDGDNSDYQDLLNLRQSTYCPDFRRAWRTSRQHKMKKYEQLELPKLELADYIFRSSSDEYSGESGSEMSDIE
ncbi:hypothetical protein K456DRAFT_1863871 [Colletotrichum gloeosporioides 23]|nr:hypothetical protein K456DRAFT_1863871 [Colletotrichum gloeosporioides 23]